MYTITYSYNEESMDLLLDIIGLRKEMVSIYDELRSYGNKSYDLTDIVDKDDYFTITLLSTNYKNILSRFYSILSKIVSFYDKTHQATLHIEENSNKGVVVQIIKPHTPKERDVSLLKVLEYVLFNKPYMEKPFIEKTLPSSDM